MDGEGIDADTSCIARVVAVDLPAGPAAVLVSGDECEEEVLGHQAGLVPKVEN